MLKQQVKDILFFFNQWASLPSTWAGRLRFRTPARPEGHYLHLGCGPKYVEGMINCDGNRFRRIDLWLDLRNGLPFRDKSVAFIWLSHTLEHLFPDEALHLLGEMRRVLTDEGIARVAVPCLEHALKIARGEVTDFYPRRFEDPMAQAINHLFVDGQHKFGYSFSVMDDFARQAGFTRIDNYSAANAETPKTYGPVTVGNEPKGSLIVELRR
ncbi:MAG: methyltransferase domain-containing protein [Phycisphaeraceae bacterium]|nr:methyltransferase domain-containing protein [Phycisphaeraceae bacterium]